jgi:hypothetical protein
VALWRLPRPDFHRLVDTDFQDTPLTLRPARSRSRLATLYTESSDSFVASAAASIATGWSEPVPGRELHPLESSAFHGALLRQLAAMLKFATQFLLMLEYPSGCCSGSVCCVPPRLQLTTAATVRRPTRLLRVRLPDGKNRVLGDAHL